MSDPSTAQPCYDDPVDFQILASQDADFAKILASNRGKMDFHNPLAVKQLTISLLRRDFGLNIELPDDRLCPPVPVRYNYVRWIQDIIDTTRETHSDQYDPHRKVTGLDIGVGSSNIYSLLFLATRPSWQMAGTDIDSTNLAYAQRNTVANDFSNRMKLISNLPTNPLIPFNQIGVKVLDFIVCNPPFFTSIGEMRQSLSGSSKSAPPSSICTGTEVEMVTEGGDAGFALRLVEESSELRERVAWYSTMLGKLESVTKVVAKLKELGVTNWAVAQLRTGGKTRRWAVAWSWGGIRPRNDTARHAAIPHNLLPFPSSFMIPISTPISVVIGTVIAALSPLDLNWIWKETENTGIGSADENVWSRAARRKRRKLEIEAGKTFSQEGNIINQGDNTNGSVALEFKIIVREENVEICWLKGTDHVLFESFCGMLKRVVQEAK